MLAYAASRPRVAARRQSPNAMLAIIVGHIALVAVVMSAKMELPVRILEPPLKVDLIEEDDPPPPTEIQPRIPSRPRSSTLDQPPTRVPARPTTNQTVDSSPSLPNFDELIGTRNDPPARTDPVPASPVRIAALLLTPASNLKPPYPSSKLASEEEAVLRLRLTIDERGRVVAVEPIGRADRAFLDSARRHLIAHWRYRPATEDGRAVSSLAVITLRFQLDA